MNFQSQNHLYQLQDAINIFSSVTGITIHSVVHSDNFTSPVLCDNCVKMIKKHLLLPDSSFYCNLYIFPCGAVHIFTDSVFDTDVYFISEPIICNPLHVNLCAINRKTPLKYLQANQLCNVAMLLYLSVNCSLDPFFNKLPYQKTKNELTEAVACGDFEKIFSIIDETLDDILAECGLDFIKTKSACLRILFLLQEISADQIETLSNESKYDFSFSAFAEADTLGKLKLCITSACDDFICALKRASEIKKNMVINRAIELIKRNFKEKITQNSVANAVYLSPSYFSKLFKEVTNYNFSEYLNITRIEKAKELLEKASLTIDEVYQQVGFENRSYFGKIFRKYTGLTPKQYKDAFKNLQ